MKRKIEKSLHDWCIENGREDVLELWDYDLNEDTPKDISYGSNKKRFFKCPKNLHKSEEKIIKVVTKGSLRCEGCRSFGQWCIDNNEQQLLLLWDYEINNCSPFEINYCSPKKHYFKCPRNLHPSEKRQISNLTCKNSTHEIICSQCNSIGQFLVDTFGEDGFKKRWSNKNTINPFCVSRCSGTKVWINCLEVDYHVYDISCANIYNGRGCSFCNSFASHRVHPKDSFGQVVIDGFGEDFLNKLWCWDKNKKSPFEISPKTDDIEVWLNCLDTNYHDSYKTTPMQFTMGSRCPYCCNHRGRVHPKDSFAQYHIDNTDQNFLEEYWSKKNTIDPFGIAPNYSGKIWIICQNDKEHEDYEITGNNFTQGKRCGKCRESHGEREVVKWLNTKNIEYIREKTFEDLLGTGDECLRYDFYLPDYNFLIEYQGSQHESPQEFFGGEKQFIKQQEHDRRKREYAEQNGIQLLEIWYWDFDNIETILNKNIK